MIGLSSHPCFLIVSSLLVFVVHLSTAAVPISLHGLNYNTRKGPDWDPDKCKEWHEVLNDLTLQSRLTKRFRLLSMTDCGQAAMVLEVAKQLDLQLWLGLWVGQPPESSDVESAFDLDLKELKRLIDEEPDVLRSHVLGISVGSEALYRKDATLDQMIQHFYTVKQVLSTAGIDLPVTICDIAPEYAKNSELRDVVDVTMTNTFPFWEGIDVSVAVDDLQEDLGWLLSQAESVTKPFVLGETGWPSAGFIEGVGIASPQNQRIYFETTYCRLRENGWDYYWFTGIDNDWRLEQDPNNTIEGNWGFFYANSTLKPHFQDLAFTCDDGVTFDFSLVDFTLPGYTAAPTALDPASCSAHPDCADLLGDCCPGSDGLFLLCCDSTITAPTSAPKAPSVKPSLAPVSPTASPVSPTSAPKAPSVKPSLAPVSPTASPVSPTRSPTRRPVAQPPTLAAGTEHPTSEPASPSPTAKATTVPSPPTPKPTIAIAFRPVSTVTPTAVDFGSLNGASLANQNSGAATSDAITCLSLTMITITCTLVLFHM